MLSRAYPAVALALLFCRPAGAEEAAKCEGPPELKKAIAAEPSQDAYSALGFWFVDRGNHTCAISAFRSAVTLNGESVRARYNLGIALYESGDDEGAITHLKEAVRLSPGELNVRQALDAAQLRLKRRSEAAQRMRIGDFAGAARAYREYLRNMPDDALARYNLAMALLKLGQRAEAEKELEETVRLKPTSPLLR